MPGRCPESTIRRVKLPGWLDGFPVVALVPALAAVVIQLVTGKLPPEERAHTAMVAGNYGQAGAINYHGRRFGLPAAYSQRNSYYLWGRPDGARSVLVVGAGRARLQAVFESVTEVARRSSAHATLYEAELPIYLCRGLEVPLDEAWRRGKHYI
jgi:hypothetical protein